MSEMIGAKLQDHKQFCKTRLPRFSNNAVRI